MEIYRDIIQGTPEWDALRLGSIGASSIGDAVAGGQGKVRNNLLYRLAGEILSGKKYVSYKNEHMERGIEREAEARLWYELATGNQVEQVGLIKESEHLHYSPDGLINPDGLLEIKNRIPSVHIETICENKIPPGDRKQCQWGLAISQRSWLDYVSYCPEVIDKPGLVIRTGRDEKVIEELRAGADKLLYELAAIIKKVKT